MTSSYNFLYVQNILNAWFANNQFELMLICVFSAWMSFHYLPFEYDCVLMGCHWSFWCQIPVKWHDCLVFCQCVPWIIWIPFGIMIHQLNVITIILANGRKSSACYCSMFYWTCTLPSNFSYKGHQILKLKCFSSRLAVIFVQSFEARC